MTKTLKERVEHRRMLDRQEQDRKARHIIELYTDLEKRRSMAEIGRLVGMSRQRVGQIINEHLERYPDEV